MNGHVQLFHDRTIPGPYKKEAREYWLRRVLEAQQSARKNGPADFRDIQLITLDELTKSDGSGCTRSMSLTIASPQSTRR